MTAVDVEARRLRYFEIATVVSVGLLGSIAGALLSLVDYIAIKHRTVLVPTKLAGHPWLDSVTQSIGLIAVTVGPLLLVAYVLHNSGESLAAIGLRDKRFFNNMARAAGVVLLLFVSALVVLAVLKAVGIRGISSGFDTRSTRWAYLPVGLVGAARSGLLEEIIVAGYLLHRLAQLGWSETRALWASVLLRASYHFYGGVTLVAFTLVFGFIMARIYQRTGRLWVLILAHFMWDAIAFTAAIATH